LRIDDVSLIHQLRGQIQNPMRFQWSAELEIRELGDLWMSLYTHELTTCLTGLNACCAYASERIDNQASGLHLRHRKALG
jgi:hypothetical protein